MRTRNQHFWRLLSKCFTIVIVLNCMMVSPAYTAEVSQGKAGFFHQVREINTSDLGIPNPAGLSFSPKTDNFQVINSNPTDQALQAFTDLRLVTLDEKFNGAITIPFVNLDPINSTFDEQTGSLLILDRGGHNLVVIPSDSDGNLQPSMLSSHNIKSWGLKQPKGITVDQDGGQIFILDLSEPRLVIFMLQSTGDWADACITEVDLQQIGIGKPQGLALDPANGNLHIYNHDDQTLYEITQFGQIVAKRNLSSIKLSNPQALLFAPSFDQTDNPHQMSLYLADSRQSSGTETGAVKDQSKKSNPGRIIELSLYQPVVMAASTFRSELKHTIDTSKLTPPSPDPCGVDYIPSSNTLLICDSEVEEMANLWVNANLFETTLNGTLVRKSNTIAFTKEPTGLAYNSANEHIFISDDDGHRIFEIAPGTDKLYGTSDDVRTVFKTSYFGSNDPEGVAIDSTSNTLFIVDGINEEVYLVRPGSNGRFDGVPPYSDDQVISFDTTIIGVHDPEGISFNPDTGHLYITDTPSRTSVAEVTIEGALVQIIDISAASAIKPAGIGFGPSSTDFTTLAMYVADRGVDNNGNPTENDGKVYELTISTSNSAPIVRIDSPGNEAVYNQGDAISFSGSASDAEDGTLSSSMTWTSSRDGAISTGSSFTLTNLTVGTHTISAAVTDSKGLSASASITITVDLSNSAPIVRIDSPGNEAVYNQGDAISFSGSASDAEDGTLSSSMTWTSSRDGMIGTGSAFTLTNLTVGAHTISAAVTDSNGLTDSASVAITVNPSNYAPIVNIESPENKAVYYLGDTITFSGNASDAEDGTLSSSMKWTSSRDGMIGTGSSFALTSLSVGTHTISASVTDSKGLSASARVTITVNQSNSAPIVRIDSPGNEAVYNQGDAISFSGSASDAEDGALSLGMKWTSSRDGMIGIGSSFALTSLSVGNHTIRASVADSKGLTGLASVTITVNPISKISKYVPTDDAKVSSKNSKTNYGSTTTLELIKSTDTFRSYLKFNVTGLSGTIKSAKIRVYSVKDSAQGGSAYTVSNNYKGTNIPWLENGLLWKNAPSITGEPLSTMTSVTANSWVDFDVTVAIIGDGEYSFALVNTSSRLTVYNSSEANLNRPELVIETV